MPNLKITCKYPEHTVTTPTGSEEHKFDKAILKGLLENHGCRDVNIVKLSSKRSLLLNRALHLWFTQIVSHCSNLGLTIGKLFKEPAELELTEESIKYFFRELGKFLYNKESTADLTNKEMCKVIEQCERIFAERLDYTEEFPNKEQLLLGKLKK